jgi:hypothetical protein
MRRAQPDQGSFAISEQHRHLGEHVHKSARRRLGPFGRRVLSQCAWSKRRHPGKTRDRLPGQIGDGRHVDPALLIVQLFEYSAHQQIHPFVAFV